MFHLIFPFDKTNTKLSKQYNGNIWFRLEYYSQFRILLSIITFNLLKPDEK